MPRFSAFGLRSAGGAMRGLPRDVVVLGIVAFFVMLGFGVVIPVLPVFVHSFDVGYTQIGAVVAAFALMRLVATPFVGRLVDRGGERTVLAIGIGIVAISSGLVGLAQSYLEVLLLRGAGGIGSAMFSVSAMTLLLRSAPPPQRGRSLGFYQGGFLIGGMAGPALGGILAAVSLRAPFFFYAVTLLIAGLVGLLLLSRATGRAPTDDPALARPLRSVVTDPRFVAACLANFSQGWGSMGVRSALIPVLVVELLHQRTEWTGIAFAVAAVAQTIALAPAGRFVDTVGRRPAMIGALTLGGMVLFLVPFAPNMVVLMILLAVYGVAAAFLGTAPAAALGDAAGPRSGTPVAVFSAMSDLGAIIGPLAAGALLDTFGYTAAFSSATVLMLLAAAFAFRMPRERHITSG